jgi:hypothetical protein
MSLTQDAMSPDTDNINVNFINNNTKIFRIVSVGWGVALIERILEYVEKQTDLEFHHILGPEYDLASFSKLPTRIAGKSHCLREDKKTKFPKSDGVFLKSLETREIPTIHNMIMSDRVLRHIDYSDALGYLTHIAERLFLLFNSLNPSVVLGSFDNGHQGIALAVAKKLSIPFVAMNFSVIPRGYCCFCTSMSPNSRLDLDILSSEELKHISEETIRRFLDNGITAAAYVSSRGMYDVIRKVPFHISLAISEIVKLLSNNHDQFTDYSTLRLVSQYLRKRRNLFMLPNRVLITKPPTTPYLFIGLHLQPESSIDVWAPFFSNQFSVIEAISRSMPPSHHLLVKIHKSDSDGYSPRQLEQFQALPGVLLVSPFVDSRPFIVNANVVLAIQGTIGLEAALLGLPVIMFGDSPVLTFTSASRVGAIVDLPKLIRKKISEKRCTSEQINDSYRLYLRPFCPASHNDWDLDISSSELNGYVRLFDGLKNYVQKHERLQDNA